MAHSSPAALRILRNMLLEDAKEVFGVEHPLRHNYLARKVEDHSHDIPVAERTFRAMKLCFGGPAKCSCRSDIKRRMRGEDWELSQ